MILTELNANGEILSVALGDPASREIPQLRTSLFQSSGAELLQLKSTTRDQILAGYDHAYADRVLKVVDSPSGQVIGRTPFVQDAKRATDAAVEAIRIELALRPWPLRIVPNWRRNRVAARIRATGS